MLQELIKKLEKIYKEYGNIEIILNGCFYDCDLDSGMLQEFLTVYEDEYCNNYLEIGYR